MKVLCDVHISYKIVRFFKQQNIESFHVNELPDKWFSKDTFIANYADGNSLVLITKDEDFKNSHFLQSKPKHVIRITLGNISNDKLITIFSRNLELISNAMQSEKCYLEINEQFLELNQS
jgi:predicted nuclease of predicted toxin-antitoxin system